MGRHKKYGKRSHSNAKHKNEGQVPLFTYTTIEYDDAGWADAERWKPFACDLVALKLVRKTPKGFIRGWWTGFGWYGLRLLDDDVVVKWKRVIHMEP